MGNFSQASPEALIWEDRGFFSLFKFFYILHTIIFEELIGFFWKILVVTET